MITAISWCAQFHTLFSIHLKTIQLFGNHIFTFSFLFIRFYKKTRLDKTFFSKLNLAAAILAPARLSIHFLSPFDDGGSFAMLLPWKVCSACTVGKMANLPTNVQYVSFLPTVWNEQKVAVAVAANPFVHFCPLPFSCLISLRLHFASAR